jgi:hypothetical protein
MISDESASHLLTWNFIEPKMLLRFYLEHLCPPAYPSQMHEVVQILYFLQMAHDTDFDFSRYLILDMSMFSGLRGLQPSAIPG